jgi:8-oxo-dGTP diphosphatase
MRVVAAVIIEEGLVLGVKRSPKAITHPNQWEFPGGKVESHESDEAAIIREVKEELDMVIEVDIPIYQAQFLDHNREIELIYLLCRRVHLSKIHLIEHQSFYWFNFRQFNPTEWLPHDHELFVILKNNTLIKF